MALHDSVMRVPWLSREFKSAVKHTKRNGLPSSLYSRVDIPDVFRPVPSRTGAKDTTPMNSNAQRDEREEGRQDSRVSHAREV